jgi:D-alanine-D-alanine ligase
MKKLNVAILFGGRSGEHEVSIVSAMSVFTALDKLKYNVTLIGIDKQGRWLLPDQSQLLMQQNRPDLVKLNTASQTVSLLPFPAEKNLIAVTDGPLAPFSFDVVLPILHGTNGEDGTIQGLLELSQIPYVGSGVLGSALVMDKEMAKKVLDAAGIKTVPFMTAYKYNFDQKSKDILDECERRFGYPYFVKPANMGSSVGVNKVKNREEALAKFTNALQYDTKILVEKFIKGRELECAILGNHEPKASIVGEVIPKHEFYSYEAKYIDEDGAELCIPALGLKEEFIKRVQLIAINSFKALQCSGLARVDFFYDELRNEIYVNELNTIPGFTKISMYPKLWDASGLKYSELLDALIKLALEKSAERKSLKTTYATLTKN